MAYHTFFSGMKTRKTGIIIWWNFVLFSTLGWCPIVFGAELKSDSFASLAVLVGHDTPNGESWEENVLVNNSDKTVVVVQQRIFDGSYSSDLFDFRQVSRAHILWIIY